MPTSFEQLFTNLNACQICSDRFAATPTGHSPRPIVWFSQDARILIAGQAPGMRVYKSGRPFTDPSGDRLRDWMGLSESEFYDRDRVAIVPMAFCFPGYDAKGSDLPPPPICGKTWHAQVMEHLKRIRLKIVVGGPAQKWHLGTKANVTETVADWRSHAPTIFTLPHPSWRNSGWLKRNPWFESELLPALQAQVKEVMNG